MACKEPISSQPKSVSSCDSENADARIAKGVQLFEDAEKFVIQRMIKNTEKWYSPNTYNISMDENTLMKPLLVAKEEESDKMCLRSLFCCNQRAFDMKLVDDKEETVMWLEHPSSCNWPVFCPSCRPGMIVRTSSGRILGYVEHATRDTCGSWLPPSLYYNIADSKGKSALKIEGPACKYECCSTTEFRYNRVTDWNNKNDRVCIGFRQPLPDRSSHDRTSPINQYSDSPQLHIYSSKWNSYVGEIRHDWQGSCDGFFSCCVTSEEDKTIITFPREMNVIEKALLLGAVLLTHINYFEHV